MVLTCAYMGKKKPNLYVQIVYIIKKIFDSIFLSDVMKHNKPYM